MIRQSLCRTAIVFGLAAATVLAASAMAATAAGGSPAPARRPAPNAPCNPESLDGIMSYPEMVRELHRVAARSRGRVTVHDQGDSVEGRDLLYARVGTGPTVLFTWARIHGDEYVGTRPLLGLLDDLGGDTARARLLRRAVTVYAIPIWNPDGSEAARRTGAPLPGFPAGQDLNRDWITPDDPGTVPAGSTSFIYPESRAWYDLYAQVKPAYVLDIHEFGEPAFVPGTSRLVQFQIGTAHAVEHVGGETGPQYLRSRQLGQVALDSVQRTRGSAPARFVLSSVSGQATRSALRRMIHDGKGYLGDAGPAHTPVGGLFFEIPTTDQSNDIAFSERLVRRAIDALLLRIATGTVARVNPAEFDALPSPEEGTCG